MFIRASVFLLYCFLLAVPGCDSKSEVTRQSASPQPSPSPQQAAPPASGGISNVQGEQKPETASGTDAGGTAAKTDACNLITKAEIEAVQGEAVSATKSSSRSSGAFAISQCFYTVATFNKSVSLELTRSNPTSANQSKLKDFWKQRFHMKADQEEDEKEGEKEKEAEKPRPVSGVGDEAFWTGNSKAGALYVLKNNAFIRISLGGADDQTVKINKAKMLAQKALGRF